MSDKPTIYYDNLDNWKGGSNDGYCEQKSNCIHVLKGEYQELRTVNHEIAHLARRDKLTFKLASLANTPLILGAITMLLVLTLLLQEWPSFFVIAVFNGIILLCGFHEEKEANKVMMQYNKLIMEKS